MVWHTYRRTKIWELEKINFNRNFFLKKEENMAKNVSIKKNATGKDNTVRGEVANPGPDKGCHYLPKISNPCETDDPMYQ